MTPQKYNLHACPQTRESLTAITRAMAERGNPWAQCKDFQVRSA